MLPNMRDFVIIPKIHFQKKFRHSPTSRILPTVYYYYVSCLDWLWYNNVGPQHQIYRLTIPIFKFYTMNKQYKNYYLSR